MWTRLKTNAENTDHMVALTKNMEIGHTKPLLNQLF